MRGLLGQLAGLAMILAAVLGACHRQLTYLIVVRNAGKEIAADISVGFPKFSFEFGSAGPGIGRSYLDPTAPIPKSLTVRWTSETMGSLRSEVRIVPEPPPGFSGFLCIEIKDTIASAYLAPRTIEGCEAPRSYPPAHPPLPLPLPLPLPQ